MQALTTEEARLFCERWLPAWTGNDPERLASFYTDDVFYSDPTLPDGVSGKSAFLGYMKKLLRNNPDWVWTHEIGIPLQDGFLNKWKADVPVGDRTIQIRGVCSVQLRGGLIYRNEVYFDATALLNAIAQWNRQKKQMA